MHTIVFGTTDL